MLNKNVRAVIGLMRIKIQTELPHLFILLLFIASNLCRFYMLGQYINVRPVYQFGELSDAYEFNLGALHSDRSKFGSIAHNCEATYSSDHPLNKEAVRDRAKILRVLSHVFIRLINHK